MSEGVCGGQEKWGEGSLRTDGRVKGGEGGASLLGGALYFGEKWFGGGVFFRVCASLCVLSEQGNCEWDCGEGDFCGTVGGDFSGADGAGGE